jgi:SAM-dependent methyltransferase
VTPHGTIYEAAALYDLAFSYRDFPRESRFLSMLYEARRGRKPRTFLELAAGPGRHALEMQAAGVTATALDVVPEMAEYARNKAAERGVDLDYLVADMTRFETARRFDLAACMLCSGTYLITDAAFRSHLGAVHAALTEDGMYVLELPHPSELDRPKTKGEWTMRDAAGELFVEWIEDETARDGNTWLARVRFEYRPLEGSAPRIVSDASRQRDFTPAEIESFAAETGFLVEDVFGALDENIALDHEKAWRMLVVLRRKSP